ncbi:MAG: sigma-70 family RNA polymerase sigma factor [Planctomycetes bacterium]|nr:sigma-70 family RNA polymerase sigma factor [Planctomycetota bacterium]
MTADGSQPAAVPASALAPVSSTGGPASPGMMGTLAASLPAALTGDLMAVDLLTREEGALRRVLQRYVKDASTVDDLFQEVSLKVLRRVDSVRDPAAIRGWLFQLARNACLDYLRREDRRRQDPTEILSERTAGGDLGRGPVERLVTNERLDAVRRALAQLPVSQREVIRLRVEEGLDHVAIAERLGISRQAVEVRLCRGRATLKSQLDAIIEGEL